MSVSLNLTFFSNEKKQKNLQKKKMLQSISNVTELIAIVLSKTTQIQAFATCFKTGLG